VLDQLSLDIVIGSGAVSMLVAAAALLFAFSGGRKTER
jgi:hypothetical protein